MVEQAREGAGVWVRRGLPGYGVRIPVDGLVGVAQQMSGLSAVVHALIRRPSSMAPGTEDT